MTARIPAELRRGCAANRLRGERKTLAHTEAVKRIMPAWATAAVPGDVG